MDYIRDRFNDIYPIPKDEIDIFLTFWKKESLPKGSTIIHRGEIASKLFYVQSGSIRSFFEKEGKEVTEWIALENTFVFPPNSLFLQKPGRLTFQTVEPSIVYSINIVDIERMSASSHHTAQFYRHILTSSIVAAELRIESLLTGSAVQRYKHLITQFPDIIQRVPLTHIASYIGITKETLSRVRGVKEVV